MEVFGLGGGAFFWTSLKSVKGEVDEMGSSFLSWHPSIVGLKGNQKECQRFKRCFQKGLRLLAGPNQGATGKLGRSGPLMVLQAPHARSLEHELATCCLAMTLTVR